MQEANELQDRDPVHDIGAFNVMGIQALDLALAEQPGALALLPAPPVSPEYLGKLLHLL